MVDPRSFQVVVNCPYREHDILRTLAGELGGEVDGGHIEVDGRVIQVDAGPGHRTQSAEANEEEWLSFQTEVSVLCTVAVSLDEQEAFATRVGEAMKNLGWDAFMVSEELKERWLWHR